MTFIKQCMIAVLSLFGAQIAAQAEPTQPAIYMVTLHTANFPEMKAFFKDKMKMKLISENGEFAEFKSNGLRLSLASHEYLSSFLNAETLNGIRTGSGLGIGFRYETPAQVDTAYDALLANGVKSIAAPAQQPWGEYTAFFADPDGNVHELVADTK
ncbi:VOC family protein [Pseudovibrio ascidiaceicola]|uniref:VOC family protein n=1 Tax=Pseudovibrio ascidiaceicola TaxID=285279 RepID=UPI000D685424|nr:VOC family protein [Pseudovibrio ascidiaceicola]